MLRTEQSTQQLFIEVRQRTQEICVPLKVEDYGMQPSLEVSPPKWHLAHTSWFFEEFILARSAGYKRFDDDFAYLFNSYYDGIGDRIPRPDRGLMYRPTVEEIYAYRAYVDRHMSNLLEDEFTEEMKSLLHLGLNHEQQHQELLLADIKYIYGNQPLYPSYGKLNHSMDSSANKNWLSIREGVYDIGYEGNSFSYDNEHNKHKVYLQSYEISDGLVSNAEYAEFIQNGGYEDFNLWHAEGWDWIKENNVKSPMYWHWNDRSWWSYELDGFKPINLQTAVMHISFYEAVAYANWKGLRLPTEFEWEVAADQFDWGDRWEWTNSAYLPYPGYRKSAGAIGEYNGKFMVNQMVLRGGSVATSRGHSRMTYRNFFHPHLRWQFTGLRLARDKK